MSQNCNKIAQLSEADFAEKGDAAKAATTAVLGALSDLYKAAEVLHVPVMAQTAPFYLNSSRVRLETAVAALRRNRQVLSSADPRAGALAWLRNLDYDRLYAEGVSAREIPANTAQWCRLAQINRDEGYIGVVDHMIDDIRSLLASVRKVAEGDPARDVDQPSGSVSGDLISLLAEVSDFVSFSQMIAYVNRITPLDPTWTVRSSLLEDAESPA